MAVTASDLLFHEQAPEKLAKTLGKVTASEVFFMEQDPYIVATKLGVTPSQVFFAKQGASELAKVLGSNE